MAREALVPSVFPADTAARIAGISLRQVEHWRKTKLYLPSQESFYSFRDLVALRTIAALRERGVSIQRLRRFGEWLKRHVDNPWSSMRFATAGKELLVYLNGRLVSGSLRGQLADVVEYPLDVVESETREAARLLNERRAEDFGRITRDRGVVGRQWRFAGTRVPVAIVCVLLREGCSVREILNRYPRLTRQDVEAARTFDPKRAEASGTVAA